MIKEDNPATFPDRPVARARRDERFDSSDEGTVDSCWVILYRQWSMMLHAWASMQTRVEI